MSNIYSYELHTAGGETVGMEVFAGKVLLIVNVASKCGFTPQYEGLEKLYQEFGPDDFVVLGFPCNQFGNQEPGDDGDIQSFCKLTYDVSFPVFAKIDVNGSHAHPLFGFLAEKQPGLLGIRSIKWNFTKFLVNRRGEPLHRYAPTTPPERLREDIAKLIAEPKPTEAGEASL